METPKKTYGKQGGRPKVSIGRIRKYVVSTRLSPERKLRFSALCREAGQPPAEVLRQLIDRGTVRARITREQLDFMAQLKGIARNLNQLTRLANAKGLAAVRVRHAAIVTAIEKLHDGDTVLIAEGCTHHRQCDDIGTVKIPRWLRNYTQKDIRIETASGRDFPDDLSGYALVIHCGGCMLNGREVQYRMKCAADQQVPITNYGIAIAYMQGILKRSLSVFPYFQSLVQRGFFLPPRGRRRGALRS